MTHQSLVNQSQAKKMTKTLFERLGGRAGISKIVDDTVENHMTNPNAFLFANTDFEKKFNFKGFEFIGSWMDHYRSWAHNRLGIPICIIKYEDLIKWLFNIFMIDGLSNTSDENSLEVITTAVAEPCLKNASHYLIAWLVQTQLRRVRYTW